MNTYVDITETSIVLNQVLSKFKGKKFDETLFKQFNTEFRDALKQEGLADLRAFIRYPAPTDKPYIQIAPMRPLDAIALQVLLGVQVIEVPVVI